MNEEQMIQFFASKQDVQGVKQDVRGVKDELHEFRNEIMTVLDQQTGILRRLDEERVFGSERVNRIEKRVEKTEKDITELKVKVASI